MTTLTIPLNLLRRIYEAIGPAAAEQVEAQPIAFSETMRIDWYRREDLKQDVLRFYCTDGFRLHTVELDKEDLRKLKVLFPEGAEMVLGVKWLGEQLERTLPDKVAVKADFDHSWWTVSLDKQVEKFQIPVWPEIDKLISATQPSEDGAAGFNIDYFDTFMSAAMTWHDYDEDDTNEDETVFPLLVHRMAPKSVCHFSIGNHFGVLRVLLMPVISRWGTA